MGFSTKKDFEHALVIVRKEINQWDPYALIASGSLDDEFDGEIRSIVKEIPRIGSETDAAYAVSRTFGSSFDASDFPVEKCESIGRNLYQALIRERLIDTGYV